MLPYTLHHATWAELEADARLVRTAVFIEEQHIAAEDEWDDEDVKSLHFVIYEQNQAIATARLMQNHHVGRVAVLQKARGSGVGQWLMREIIARARAEHRPYLKLSAQTHAIGFYENLGFKVEGESYLDCGIPHVDMQLLLT